MRNYSVQTKGDTVIDLQNLSKQAGKAFEKIRTIIRDGTVTVEELRSLNLPDAVVKKAEALDKDGNGLGVSDLRELMQRFPEIKDKLLSHFDKKR